MGDGVLPNAGLCASWKPSRALEGLCWEGPSPSFMTAQQREAWSSGAHRAPPSATPDAPAQQNLPPCTVVSPGARPTPVPSPFSKKQSNLHMASI